MKRYSGKIFNQNGYEISREGNTIKSVANSLAWFPLEVFDGWIFDRKENRIVRRLERVGVNGGKTKGFVCVAE